MCGMEKSLLMCRRDFRWVVILLPPRGSFVIVKKSL